MELCGRSAALQGSGAVPGQPWSYVSLVPCLEGTVPAAAQLWWLLQRYFQGENAVNDTTAQ